MNNLEKYMQRLIELASADFKVKASHVLRLDNADIIVSEPYDKRINEKREMVDGFLCLKIITEGKKDILMYITNDPEGSNYDLELKRNVPEIIDILNELGYGFKFWRDSNNVIWWE